MFRKYNILFNYRNLSDPQKTSLYHKISKYMILFYYTKLFGEHCAAGITNKTYIASCT